MLNKEQQKQRKKARRRKEEEQFMHMRGCCAEFNQRSGKISKPKDKNKLQGNIERIMPVYSDVLI